MCGHDIQDVPYSTYVYHPPMVPLKLYISFMQVMESQVCHYDHTIVLLQVNRILPIMCIHYVSLHIGANAVDDNCVYIFSLFSVL